MVFKIKFKTSLKLFTVSQKSYLNNFAKASDSLIQ